MKQKWNKKEYADRNKNNEQLQTRYSSFKVFSFWNPEFKKALINTDTQNEPVKVRESYHNP